MSDDQRERHPRRDQGDSPREDGTRSDFAGQGEAAPVDPDVGEGRAAPSSGPRRAAPIPGPSRAGADRTMFPNDPVAGGAPGETGTGASGGYGADSGFGSSGGSPDGNEGDPAAGGAQTDWLRSSGGGGEEEPDAERE